MFLQPVFGWLLDKTLPGDYLLVQGDFGAVCLTVAFTRKHGFIPVYSTTQRETAEVRLPDGTVKKQSMFRHVRYREYHLNRDSSDSCDNHDPLPERP